MKQQVFVNLPVIDLGKSKDFFTQLGYIFQPEFTNEQAACMIISDTIYVMLVTLDFFKSFSDKEIADASKVIELQLAFNLESKSAVDAIANKAKSAGSPKVKEGKDEDGFMYSRGFEDLDHHMWDYFYMDTSAIPPSLKQ